MSRPYGLAFIPYIFDNKEAWELTIDDPRFSVNMPFNKFMEIYIEHRNSLKNKSLQNPLTETTPQQYISQEEINALLIRGRSDSNNIPQS
jgi:hypothetical protein